MMDRMQLCLSDRILLKHIPIKCILHGKSNAEIDEWIVKPYKPTLQLKTSCQIAGQHNSGGIRVECSTVESEKIAQAVRGSGSQQRSCILANGREGRSFLVIFQRCVLLIFVGSLKNFGLVQGM